MVTFPHTFRERDSKAFFLSKARSSRSSISDNTRLFFFECDFLFVSLSHLGNWGNSAASRVLHFSFKFKRIT